MIKLQISQRVICELLSKISFALENKDDLETYTHIGLRLSDHSIRITASNRFMNTEATIHHATPLPTISVGFPGYLTYKIVKSLPDCMLEFLIDGPQMTVRGGRSKINIPILSSERFQDFFPEKTDYNSNILRYVNINIIELMKSIKQVSHCLSDEVLNTNFSAVLIDKDYFVATDGLRLALSPNNAISLPEDCNILIPSPIVPRIWKVYNNSKEGLFSLSETQMHLKADNIACCFNLKAGKYPNYKSILPLGGIDISINRLEALDSLKRILVIKNKDSDALVEIRDGYLFLKSDSDLGQVNEAIPCDHLKKHVFLINARFLFDALNQCLNDKVTLVLHHDTKEITVIEVREGSYRNVIKPKRIG